MRMRVEHLDDALGIGRPDPRLSWQLPTGSTRQDAYELEVDGTSYGVVLSPNNVLVGWPAAPLTSRQRTTVRVRVSADGHRLDWSEPTEIEAGLLHPDDWTAAWVAPDEGEVARPGHRPAYRLRGTVRVDRPVVRARLHVTARGVHETYVDGARVGDVQLAPGFTDYDHQVDVRTHDVTGAMTAGEHVVVALLADGWFRGRVGALRSSDQWGEQTAYLAQVVLDHEDGTTTVHGTGADWEWSTSHVVAADLMDGQAEDRRLVGVGDWRPCGCLTSPTTA